MPATRQALILVMAKMALADGKVSQEEHGFLDSMLEPEESLETLLEIAKASSLKDLVTPIERYADRFFVALRAACIAHIDIDFDAQEETVLAALFEELGITDEDRDLIMDGVQNLDNPEAVPHPRIEKLFEESSFL